MNLHRHLLWVVVAAVLLPLTGCDSDHPLSDPKTSKPDERLVGKWRLLGKDGQVLYWNVGRMSEKSPKGVMRVTFAVQGKGKAEPPEDFLMFPTVLGEKTYLNVISEKGQPDRFCEEKGEEGRKAKTADSYHIFKYQVDGDRLLVWKMDGNAKARAIEGGSIKGIAKRERLGRIEFTDTSENVARFVAEAGDSLFSKESLRLERIDAGKKR